MTIGSFLHDNFSSVYWIFTKLGHLIPLWKGKNPIYFGVITIIPFDNLYRQAYFVMHTFLVFISDEYECVISDFTSKVPCIYFFLFQMTMSVSSVILHQMYLVSILQWTIYSTELQLAVNQPEILVSCSSCMEFVIIGSFNWL